MTEQSKGRVSLPDGNIRQIVSKSGSTIRGGKSQLLSTISGLDENLQICLLFVGKKS